MSLVTPIDVDALVAKIREEAARLPESLPQPAAVQPTGIAFALPAAPSAPLEVPEDPVKAFPLREAYHVHELLLYDDEDFVNVVYRALLHREADEHGMQTYLGKLRGGEPKALVLNALAHSAEGRSAGVRMAGFGAVRLSLLLKESLSRLRLGRIGAVLLGCSLRSLERAIEPLRGPFANSLRNQREVVRFAEAASIAAAGQADALRRVRDECVEALRSLSAQQQQHARELSEADRSLQLLGSDVKVQRRDLLSQQEIMARLADLAAGGGGSAASSADAQSRPAAGGANPRIDAYYVAFEDSCRGETGEIDTKLSVYLPRAAPYRDASVSLPLLDVGSGRGEWLALLAENGIRGYGVDTNAIMVAECRQRGLEVHHADVLGHLRGLPDRSLSAITGFQVIEHLSFEVLFGLLDEARRTLVEGGLILFETPNPENVLVGSHTFYHDFSHRNPITPTSISFLVRYHNFERIEIMRVNPYPEEAKVPGGDALTERVNGHLCGPQDFTILAYKPRLGAA